AQVSGLPGYPVFTHKQHTDVSYLACADAMLSHAPWIYPQFATHNAGTIAAVLQMARDAGVDFEMQRLHGMGEAIYREVLQDSTVACRVYAPVGQHRDLLAYLVRRLLENGANSSFVNRIADPDVPVAAMVADPVDMVRAMASPGARHDLIALPPDLYPDRRNSDGIDLTDELALGALGQALAQSAQMQWRAGGEGAGQPVRNPADHSDIVGIVVEADPDAAVAAVARATSSGWSAVSVAERAAMLDRAADLMQGRMGALMGLAMREAGKSAANAIAEVREAIDFLRYYAAQARETFGERQVPLGPVVCISPWNFPLAIFTGQVAAALVAGNPVLAKPAEETPLIAAEAVRILHDAGVPADALQCMPGAGEVGAALVAAPGTAAVMFTGSTDVARLIQRQLASRFSPEGIPIPLIAETGGQNAMIVDSSALAEQVVADVITSAFDSAGQRCSALRILCLQEDIADRTLAMLKGALAELRVGNTERLAVDIGPVITAEAQGNIVSHIEAMRGRGCRVDQVVLGEETEQGSFVAPTIIEIDRIEQLEREVFGPVLHVVRYRRDDLGKLVEAINATGYGLTFGLHTRLDETVARVTGAVRAGNLYINRNTIGAIVGVQPFGGRGLSGTGPKAGGPLYLGRLVKEAPAILPAALAPPQELVAFAEWLDAQGEAQAAAGARTFGASSSLGVELVLPGPVGERNVYALHPRGRVLLRPATRAGLLGQMAAVLATGNRASVEGMAIPPGLPAPIADRFRDDPCEPFAACLVEGGEAAIRDACIAMAKLDGPIVPVHVWDGDGVGPGCTALLEEVSTSVNTTAAGGNASLMMIG
ncbi:MAG: bifunctional proline dehydrogenase/L-glutamate gamma-semialdehyde dehydrogenase PutA, partial [Sphingobium sp.]